MRGRRLPPHLPGGAATARAPYDGPPRLLALGMVREYKGVDLLLRALRQVPGVTLTVAGELWGSSGTAVRELAADPRVRGRVSVRAGYVPADRLAELLASHDVLALTYRSATASQNALLGYAHGLPVLASDVGTFGRRGPRRGRRAVVPPGRRATRWSTALRRLSEPAHAAPAAGQRAHPGPVQPVGPLRRGARGAGSPRRHRGPAGTEERRPAADGRRRGVRPSLRDRAPRPPLRRATAVPAPALTLTRSDLPDWIRASDVLTDGADADEARAWARALGLPRAGDPVAAWAALGAVAAIVRVQRRRPAQRRHHRRVAAARSPLARWARAIGFAPVELGLTGERASVEVLDVDTGGAGRHHPAAPQRLRRRRRRPGPQPGLLGAALRAA